VSLPYGAGHPHPLGIDGARSPFAVATALRHSLGQHPSLALEALVLAGAAAALPFARRFGFWGLAVFGAALTGGTVLAAPHANPLPAVLTAWATAIGVALWDTRATWLPAARSAFGSPLAN
jgi:hypothetical protein